MKKNFFLTLLLALLSITTGLAQFAPEAGKMYALKETTTGLYLDIQTTGVVDNNESIIHLRTTPCIIYFEEGTAEGTWKIKNANGQYVGDGLKYWNAVIGGSEKEWYFIDEDTNIVSISKDNSGNYIGCESVTATDGLKLFNDAEAGNTNSVRVRFSLVEYPVNTHVYSTLKASKLTTDSETRDYDSYMSMTTSGNTALSFQKTPGQFHIIPSANAYVIMQKDTEPAKYVAQVVSGNDTWNVSASEEPYLWLISEEDTDGYVTISKFSNSAHNLGHDTETTEGTGIFANVGTGCNKWLIEETETYTATAPATDAAEVSVIDSYGQYVTSLALNGITVLAGLSVPADAASMYVVAGVTGVTAEKGSESKFALTFPKSQNSQGLVARVWFDSDADGTFEALLGTTGSASSYNDISTVTFTVPAEATEGLTYIRLRLDSSWNIGDNANAATKRMVYDIPVKIVQAQAYTFKIVNPSGETVTATYGGNPIADGDLIEGGVDVNKVSANEIEGYTWNVVVDNEERTVTLVYEKKYSYSIVNLPDGAVISFDGNTVSDGDYLDVVFDSRKLAITGCPDGYTWDITVDNENKLVIITFTQLVTVENPQAVVNLVNRIGGEGTADNFKFVLQPSLNYTDETFVIGSEEVEGVEKILIKGSTLSALTTGLGWYLQNIAHINIAWNSLNEKTVSGDAYADLSNIPVPTAEETHTSDAKYRYYLNYCTFGYSMTTWTWNRWQQEIDWMALHGINMPLQLVGLEEVWRKFLTMEVDGKRKYNYTDEEAKAFVPGPAYTPWWGMNNLQGWGGTGSGDKITTAYDYTVCEGTGGVQDDKWYVRQANLAEDILARQRELGMHPVLPGFSGMVPTNFTTKTGVATDPNGNEWQSFWRPRIIDPTADRFAEIAADYYACLEDVMGVSQYYSMDPFHEGGAISSGKYSEAYYAVYEAMEQAKPASQWVIQQWHWYENTNKIYSIDAVPAGRLVVLDLFSDGSPAFDSYDGYDPQHAVFCAIPNFGGRSGLMGRLTNLTDNYFSYKEKYPSTIKGIGAAPEAIEQTPVTYDLIFQLPWMNGVKPDVAEWVNSYAVARYGVDNDEIKEAWSLLRQGPLNYGADGIEGPIEDVWGARPNLDANPASKWGKTINIAGGTYTKARQQMLIDATYKLISQSGAITSGSVYESNYKYDLVEFGGAVLADYAYYLLLGIRDAKNAAGANFANDVTYIARKNAFLALIADVDEFKGTNLNFRLGKWTQEARSAAQEAVDLGATEADADWYEYNNARTLITTWTYKSHGLNDYSYRSWQGLLKDYYLPRWEYYFNNNCAAPGSGYFYFEWNWAHGKEHYVGQTAKSDVDLVKGDAGFTSTYTREAVGETVEVAAEVLGKYIIPVVSNSGTYYAYRYLTNDLSSVCTVIAQAGTTIDLSSYFGELTGATITGDFITDGSSTNFGALPVKSDATDGLHTGTITLDDGTVLTFAVVINPAYNGVYKVNYQNNGDVPVFVAYCEEPETGSSNGYKFIAEGTYQPVVAADKLFTISPLGTGYSLSAQGLYLTAPNLGGWDHLAFSNNVAEVGSYLFEETGTDTGIFKMRSTGSGINYVNDYNNLVFGNDDSTKENLSTFTITQVTEYTVTVPASGYTTLCLPFNVVLPDGVKAYTVEAANIVSDGNGGYAYTGLTEVAAGGETLLKGTPVIIQAAEGDHIFGVTIDNTGAKSAPASSALCGTYMPKSVNSSATAKRYSVSANDNVVFTRIDADTEIAPNSCWLETAANASEIAKYVVQGAEIVDGAVYRILGKLSNDTYRTLYTNGAKQEIRWTADTKTDASTLFIAQRQDNGSFKLVSALANGIWDYERTLSEEGVELYFETGTQDGTYTIYAKSGSDFRSYSAENNGNLGYYTRAALENLYTTSTETVTTDFVLQQINDVPVNFTVGFDAKQQWATMYLPFAVTVPDGVEACYADDVATDIDAQKSKITMTSIGSVVPAYCPVVLYRSNVEQAQDLVFEYNAEAVAEKPANIFGGCLITSAVDAANKNCYLLYTFGGAGAFYWVYAEYDSSLALSNPGTNGGGYIKCDANRAYLALDAQANAPARLSFAIGGGDTTGVENVEMRTENGEVFDLQGRKVVTPSKGLYIIGGKKVLVK